MSEAYHSIKAVTRRTGLSAHVIRIWEKRYQAVTPERTGSNRRRYSEDQIQRLLLLRELTQSGHAIGSIAALPMETLTRMVGKSVAGPVMSAKSGGGLQPLLDEAIGAVKALDARRLESVLNRGAVELGSQGLLQQVIGPLAQQIGELWRNGTISAAHEHFASAVIRIFLGHASRPFAAADHSPVIVVATPSGQLHELGALLVGATAANLGWHVSYLGASLPAAEIAGAAKQNRARAVALSLVYPEDDPRLEGELMRLRDLLPAETPILVGGRAMPSYRPALESIGAMPMNDLAHLGATLETLRKPGKGAAP